MRQLLCGKTNSSRFPWHCARRSGRLDSLSVPFTTKTAMSATRASDFHPTGLHGAEECRDFDGRSLTANCELRLIKVCDEEDALSVPSSTKNIMSATRASDMCPKGPNCTKECRDDDWLSLTGNFELMLIKVCDEVSMCFCFWLTPAIATRQERLPPLLVDPTCMLKLAWCKYMQG